MPAPLYALAAIASVQVGATVARHLFAFLGPTGTVFLRVAFGAGILVAIARPRWPRFDARQWRAILLFGLVIAAMNLCFYQAIARIPLGIAVTIGGSIAFALTVASTIIANSSGGTVNTTALGQALSSSFNTLLILAAIGGAISGIAVVLFTYAIQKNIGRALLWTGYAAGIVISIVNFIIISPLIANAVSQSFSGTTYNPTAFANLQSQLQLLGLLSFIPAIIYGTAIYLAWSRVKSGEIPGPAAQPNTIVTP